MPLVFLINGLSRQIPHQVCTNKCFDGDFRRELHPPQVIKFSKMVFPWQTIENNQALAKVQAYLFFIIIAERLCSKLCDFKFFLYPLI